MSRYQPQRDRFGRPLNPDDRDRFNRNPQGPGIPPSRGPQPLPSGRDPRGPGSPARGPQIDPSGQPPRRPMNPGRGPDRDGFDRGSQRPAGPDHTQPNGGGGFNGGQDRHDRFGNGPRHPFNRFGRGNDRRNFRGRHGRHWRGRGPQGPGRNEPPPIPKDQLTNDADAFWRAGRDLDLLTDASQPTPGITLRRLGPSPFGEHAAAVELTLRRTWAAATTAAAALLRR